MDCKTINATLLDISEHKCYNLLAKIKKRRKIMTKVQIEMQDGKIINLDLYEDVAPITVENFLSYVDEGFYDGLCFHRVIDGFMIQGGGFEWKDGLVQKQGKAPIKGEFKINGVENEISHMPGVISMARTMFKDSATSQFFICVDDASFLDGQYAGFGKVSDEESLNNAIEIGKVDTGNWQYYGDVPTTPVVIKTIRRI